MALSLEQRGTTGKPHKVFIRSPCGHWRFRWDRPAIGSALLELTFHSLDEHNQLFRLVIPLGLFAHLVKVLWLLLFSKGHGGSSFVPCLRALSLLPSGPLANPPLNLVYPQVFPVRLQVLPWHVSQEGPC